MKEITKGKDKMTVVEDFEAARTAPTAGDRLFYGARAQRKIREAEEAKEAVKAQLTAAAKKAEKEMAKGEKLHAIGEGSKALMTAGRQMGLPDETITIAMLQRQNGMSQASALSFLQSERARREKPKMAGQEKAAGKLNQVEALLGELGIDDKGIITKAMEAVKSGATVAASVGAARAGMDSLKELASAEESKAKGAATSRQKLIDTAIGDLKPYDVVTTDNSGDKVLAKSEGKIRSLTLSQAITILDEEYPPELLKPLVAFLSGHPEQAKKLGVEVRKKAIERVMNSWMTENPDASEEATRDLLAQMRKGLGV